MSINLPIPAEFQEIATICAATDVVIGGQVVLGIADARKLHAGLKVGRDFSTWISGRIKTLGFTSGVDYETYEDLSSPVLGNPKSRAQTTKEYRLTLDAAKHIAMVEKNEVGRLVRSYFIWVENNARALASGSHLTAREVGGISKGVVNKALQPLQEQIASLVAEVRSLVVAHPPGVAVRAGMTAKEWLIEYKCEQKGRNPIVRQVSANLRNLAHRQGIALEKCTRTGTWVFPTALARPYMESMGRIIIRKHNDLVLNNQPGLTFPKQKKRKAGAPPFAKKPEPVS